MDKIINTTNKTTNIVIDSGRKGDREKKYGEYRPMCMSGH